MSAHAAVGVVQARSAGLGREARYRDRMASTSKIEAFLAEPRKIVVAGIRRGAAPLSGDPRKARGGCPRRRRAAARTDGGGPGAAGHYAHRAAVPLDVLGPGLTATRQTSSCPPTCPGARRIRDGR